MNWHDWLPYIIFVVTFLASILSGMAGGGGGFIVTPFLIAIGLTPQQSIATGKLGALGLDTGSLVAFRGKVTANKRFTLILVILAVVVGLLSSFFIRKLNNQHLQFFMGTLILAMMPFALIKHHKLKGRKRHDLLQALGYLFLIVIMFLQGIFSSGIGSLENVVLILFFGLTALQASLVKRKFSIALDVMVLAGLLGSGLINFRYGVIGFAGCLLGGFIGSRIAIKKGDNFARYALVFLMLVSGIYLVTTV